MSAPSVFKLKDETYRVSQKKMYQKKFKEDHAYLLSKYNDYVYPYRGEIESIKEAIEVGLYILEGVVIAIRPTTDTDKILYSKDRIIELTPDCIFRNLDDMVPDPNIEESQVASADGDLFKPSIKDTDDISLAGMKFAIGQKNIIFNQYSHKFSDSAQRNNLRRAITHGNTLKCEMASRVADIFDINYGIIYWDKQNCRYPMDPGYTNVYMIFDDEPLDMSKPHNFVTVEKDV